MPEGGHDTYVVDRIVRIVGGFTTRATVVRVSHAVHINHVKLVGIC